MADKNYALTFDFSDGSKKNVQFTAPQGPAGDDGKSAYEYAKAGGYTGTEEEFAAKLAGETSASSNVVTLWETADASVSFASQRLAIEGLSQYKGGLFTVEFAYMSDRSVDIARLRSDSATMDDDYQSMLLIHVNASNNYCFTLLRRFNIYWDTEEIGFSDCSYSAASASSSATSIKNGYVIPVRVTVRMPN